MHACMHAHVAFLSSRNSSANQLHACIYACMYIYEDRSIDRRTCNYRDVDPLSRQAGRALHDMMIENKGGRFPINTVHPCRA